MRRIILWAKLISPVFLILTGLILQLFTFSGPVSGEEGQWRFIGEDDGVKLYRSLNETKGLLPFKATAVIDASYENIVMVLVDAERKSHWAPKLKAAKVHAQLSSNCFEYSEYYQTPWPFKDREFLLLGTVTYLPDRVIFSAMNSGNKQLARKDHLAANIRMLTFEIIPISAHNTRVEFTFSGDLGGWIPEFVKTIIQKKWPVRFIQALEKYIESNDALITERYNSLSKTTLKKELQ